MTSPIQPAVPRPTRHQTPTLQPHQLLRIGQPVHVNHHASWLHATVTFVGARQVGVAFPTPTRVVAWLGDTVHPWAVRPAGGAQLRAARQVAVGDHVIFGTSVRTVATAPMPGRDGWLVVHFTDDQPPALVLPAAVLRLLDDTPQVTVNGRPLTSMSLAEAWARG